MLAQETTLREIAGRLTAAGEWDTESIYESLTEAFGNNLSLDKQSKDDTKEEERNINIKQDQLDLLWQLEEFRKKHEHQAEPSDWAIRMCEAFVARSMGFTDRVQWTELLRQKGETLFTFDWKSGSVSDHVVQWCKENNRNWRYSHLGVQARALSTFFSTRHFWRSTAWRSTLTPTAKKSSPTLPPSGLIR